MTGDFFLNHMGWECPRCGRCYSPSTFVCYSCPAQVFTYTVPYTVPNLNEGVHVVGGSPVEVVGLGSTPVKTCTCRPEENETCSQCVKIGSGG